MSMQFPIDTLRWGTALVSALADEDTPGLVLYAQRMPFELHVEYLGDEWKATLSLRFGESGTYFPSIHVATRSDLHALLAHMDERRVDALHALKQGDE